MNIVVLGGGTAGWLTALHVNRYYPNLNVFVVESEEIGILGAGEGTTPQIVGNLDELNIAVSELVKNCKATIKTGINFQNWNGDGKKYFHSFQTKAGLRDFSSLAFTRNVIENLSNDNINLPKKLCDVKKVPFTYAQNVDCLNNDPINSFYQYATWALHFDARELAKYLRMVAENRGITRIEGKLKSVLRDGNNIKALALENGDSIDSDFVFDCSGFARLLIGKTFETEWISYSDHLPLDTAVPFFIPHDNDVSPLTDAIAMKYGWIWRIPVEGRYGCGYVFDSSYIDEEQALKEAEDFFGQKLTSPKTFKFKAGTYKDTYVGNCMAVGLAQSFVEPLEATSIWINLINLKTFLDTKGIFNKSEVYRDTFNKFCRNNNQEVLDFLYLHYLTKRNDSLFWKEFREKHPMIKRVSDSIELIKQNQTPLFTRKLFEVSSWLQVSRGLELITKDDYMDDYNRKNPGDVEFAYLQLEHNQNNIIKSCVTHKELLDYLRQF